MRAANAVAPNLPPPPEERRPVSETKPLYHGSTAAAGAALRHAAMQIADYSGVFFIFVPAAPTKDSWRGRCMANRPSINSKTLPKWVYGFEF
jgi:hypothetical protein